MTFFEILEKINKIQKLQASENSNSRIEAEQDIKELENAVRGELFSLIRPLIQNTNFCELQIPAFAQSYGKYFNPGVYHELLCYTHLAHCFEPNGIPQEQALKLAILFADTDSALRYITNSGCTLHDACLFQLPPVDECHFPFWQKLAKKSMLDQRFRKLLPYANEIENLMMSAAKPKLDYQLINAKKNAINHVHHEWKQFKRKHGILNDQEKLKFQKLTQDLLLLKDELVELCKGISLHNTDLTILDAFYQYYQKTANPAYHYFLQNGLTKKDYDKFIALDRKDAGKNIPDLMVEGNEIGHPGFYLRKLPVHDDNYAALGACLGKLTNCCQSLSGEAGESCVIHGLTDPNGGFYILCKGDSKDQKSTDEILAQTWVWRSKLNVLVFDSVEISKKADIKMTVDFFRILAKDLVSKNFSPKVNCGNSSGISTRVGLNLNDVPEQFINYKGYTDSEHQNVVYKNNNPFHWYGNDHWYWYGKDQNYTAFINHKIHESIDENVPFAKVAFLCQGINWAISKQQFSILEGFKEIAKTLDRFDEIKNLIMSMELFVNKPTKNFIKDYEEQLKTYILNKQYCMDTFNNEGKTLLMVACLQGEENFAKFL
ncbi:MAG TPA: hypothetical protein VFP93_01000, partial [Gammaproteobacteria bacterium]|nr:hypothetical protein [Gammaproteobacteria bacterium]